MVESRDVPAPVADPSPRPLRRTDGDGPAHIISVDHLRDQNISELIIVLRDHGPLSRADLARRLAVARPTVTAIVKKCIAAGIVEDTGKLHRATPGRPSQNITLSSAGTRVGSLSIGQGSVDFAVVDAYGRVHAHRTATLSPTADRAAVRAALRRVLPRASTPEAEGLLGVGIVVSGTCDVANTTVVSCPAQPVLEGDYLVGVVARTVGCQAWVHEDAAAAALAETWFAHELEPRQDFACVKLAEGVGVAVFMSHRLLRGTDGLTTEFGHLPLAREGRACPCGLTDCWETVASTRWLEERRAAAPGTESGGALAARYAQNVSLGLAALVNALGVGTLVLHGPGCDGREEFAALVERETRARVLPPRRPSVRVVMSSIADSMPALSGAATVYARGFGKLLRGSAEEAVESDD